MAVAMIDVIQRWYCPNCHKEDVTKEARPHTRMHICPKLRGLTAPMIPAGSRAKVVAHGREDYVGNEIVQKDPQGRPIMSIETVRDDGNDIRVFAPTASGGTEAT
ncbi:hypothetical protein IH601_11630 [Candidatus Bipolaricaulota bacterium]|nr:hypothetical protein [Candidatus Bipolaricaulota bacterium]